MSQIDGLGGAFIFSSDPERLARWYAEHFGIEFEGSAEFGAFYTTFWALDPDEPSRRVDTTFSIMKAEAELPPPATDEARESMYGDQPFMVNLRVRDLDGVLTGLAERGITPLKRSDYDYGLFAWVYDADGNRVELYQPVAVE